jgi:5-methyltetrahydrofolate--homocysteine methyltransferase
MSVSLCPEFARGVRTEYDEIRRSRGDGGPATRLAPIADARAARLVLNGAFAPPKPSFLGTRVFEHWPLEELVERIDWTPFFQTWELKGHYPDILSRPETAAAATALYQDARTLLDRLVRERILTARAVVGFWPANTDGDDILLYEDERRTSVRMRIPTLRQQMARSDGRPNLALADFVAPVGGPADYLGGFAVTSGHGLDELVAGFVAGHDDYSAILAKSLADRLAEAFAERLHEEVRRTLWGYAPDERLANEQLIHEEYQGIRPAPGYPACPEHTGKRLLFALLDAERATGIHLTESCAMTPASSVSGWYFSHPQSRYFGVGRIGRDQVEDYARRTGMSVPEAERWLAPNLGYER